MVTVQQLFDEMKMLIETGDGDKPVRFVVGNGDTLYVPELDMLFGPGDAVNTYPLRKIGYLTYPLQKIGSFREPRK